MSDVKMYNQKTTVYKDKTKITLYDVPIISGRKTGKRKKRRSYDKLSDNEKELSKERRTKYYEHKIYELVEISKLNKLDYMLTLTFKDNITDHSEAFKRLKLFLARLRYYLKKQNSMNDLKYICGMEYQKRGAVHYHLVCNCGYIPHTILEKLWGNGYVFIKKSANDKAIAYTLKYCVKNVIESLENNNRIRFIHTSNNLIRPVVTKEWSNNTINDLIMDNLEDLICDGNFNIKNYAGDIINHVHYIECRR